MGAGAYPGTGQPAAAAQPTNLLGEAKLAFSQGNNYDGFQYLYAHYLCGDTGAADVQSHMRWSPALKRHTVAVQFGIGVVYSAPRDYTGNPMAIGNDASNKPQNAPATGRRRRGGRGGGGGPMAPMGPMAPGVAMPGVGMPGMPGASGGQSSGVRGTLDYYTGELGETLLTKLEEKLDAGMFGDVQREMNLPATAPANQGVAAAPGAFPGAPVADGLAGAPGEAAPAVGGAGKAELGAIRPGIIFLGTASSREALDKKAQEQGLDVLIVFDVKVQRSTKSKIVSNSTKISVLLVDRPQEVPIHTSATLTNVKVAAERDKEKDEDPVDQEIDRLIARLETYTTATGAEQTLKVSPFLDTLQPQHAANRVASLTASPTDHPLAVLAEIKVYHARKLITDQQFQDAAKAMLKDKADLLAKGTEKERREALAALLPKAAVAKR